MVNKAMLCAVAALLFTLCIAEEDPITSTTESRSPFLDPELIDIAEDFEIAAKDLLHVLSTTNFTFGECALKVPANIPDDSTRVDILYMLVDLIESISNCLTEESGIKPAWLEFENMLLDYNQRLSEITHDSDSEQTLDNRTTMSYPISIPHLQVLVDGTLIAATIPEDGPNFLESLNKYIPIQLKQALGV